MAHRIKEFDYIIVGLGNPGRKYENTRHNVGRMAVENFAAHLSARFYPEGVLYASARLKYKNTNILLVIPDTYMNLSGEAVKKVVSKYGVDLDKVIICVDEYNFPIGKIHLKASGGDGGHNGIANIIYELQKNEFYRLRLGIGKDFPQGGMVDYVLSKFKDEEKEPLNDMFHKVSDALIAIIEMGAAKAMSYINSGRLWEPQKQKTISPESNEPNLTNKDESSK